MIPLFPNHPYRIWEENVPRYTSCILGGLKAGIRNQPLSNALGKERRVQTVGSKLKPYRFNHTKIPERMS